MKHTKKIWALVLALVMALALGVTALAETAEIVGPNPLGPGNTPTETGFTIDFKKVVEQSGNVAPGAEDFAFEIFQVSANLGNADQSASKDAAAIAAYMAENGIKVSGTTVSTNGAKEYDGTITITWTREEVPQIFQEPFFIREKSTGKANWTYGNEMWMVIPPTEITAGAVLGPCLVYPALFDHDAGDYDTATDGRDSARWMTFTNTYTLNTAEIKIPFTKEVKLGGNTAPDKQTFELEIFDIGNSVESQYANVAYTGKVETNGAKIYNGELVISGPADEIAQYTSEGFYVREKSGNAANWTYSDAVWHVMFESTNNGPKYTIYPTTKNGDSYDDGAAVEKMTFTNTYTRNTSSTVYPTQPTKPTSSPKTFDAGIGLYAVSALLSVTGGAWMVGKKHK